MKTTFRNHKLIIAYVGTNYHGWQYQPGHLTIQEVLEEKLWEIYKQKIKVLASGRTDAGVHAKGQVVNYFAPAIIYTGKLPLVLNNMLPSDIRIKSAKFMPADFDARKSALSKKYRYQIYEGFCNDPFIAPFYHFISQSKPLDIDAMRDGAKKLEGKYDFTSFCAHASETENRVRTIYQINIKQRNKKIIIDLIANGFLHHMVRNIVGTLLEVGQGKLNPTDLGKILKSKDRSLAGPTAPSKGLFLMKVYY